MWWEDSILHPLLQGEVLAAGDDERPFALHQGERKCSG